MLAELALKLAIFSSKNILIKQAYLYKRAVF